MATRLKSGLRALLLPILRPIWIRIWLRIEAGIRAAEIRLHASMHIQEAQIAAQEAQIAAQEAQIAAQEAQIAAQEAQIAAQETRLAAQEARLAALDGAWRQHVPAFLNAVGSVDAFAHQFARLRDQTKVRLESDSASIAALWKNLEEVRAHWTTRLDNDDASIAALWQKLEEIHTQLTMRLDNESVSTAALGQKLEEVRAQSTTRLDNDDASIAALWARIEFIRREILFEIEHKPMARITDEAVKPLYRIIDTDKVAAAQATGVFRLNLGCGHIPLPDYVNVDMREVPGVDVVAEAGDLPFEPESVDEITSAHLLEHFPQERLSRQLLPHWFSLLRHGATFRAVTPDAAAMLTQAGAGSYSFEEFREAVFGAQDYSGDYHYNLLTPNSLRHLLEETGFSNIEIPFSGRRNGKCFEFEITAQRP